MYFLFIVAWVRGLGKNLVISKLTKIMTFCSKWSQLIYLINHFIIKIWSFLLFWLLVSCFSDSVYAVYVVYLVYGMTTYLYIYHMEVPQWVWRWINEQTIEFIAFFKIMSKLGTFSTLCFLGWVQAPKTWTWSNPCSTRPDKCIWECIQFGVTLPSC